MDDEPPVDADVPDAGPGTSQEVSPEQLLKLHAKMDSDANGKVSLDEILHFYRETQKSDTDKSAEQIMLEVDGDEDGFFGKQEFQGYMFGGEVEESADQMREVEKFKAADADRDGKLDVKELAVLFNPHVHHHILRIDVIHTMQETDKDKDGFVTAEEFMERNEKAGIENDSSNDQFKRIDRDGSGKIDIDEMLSWESGHIHTLEDLGQLMHVADSDGDQHVTVEELHVFHGNKGNRMPHQFSEMVEHHEL